MKVCGVSFQEEGRQMTSAHEIAFRNIIPANLWYNIIYHKLKA